MATAERTNRPLPEGYTLHHTPPSVEDYLLFRTTAATLTPVTPTQARLSLAGSWHAIHITHTSSPDHAIAMGRIVGDGGWYFCVADIVVSPEHQRKGLGDVVVGTLVDEIRRRAPGGEPGAYVSLGAAPGARGLYARHGFRETMPGNMGMGMWLEKAGLQGND